MSLFPFSIPVLFPFAGGDYEVLTWNHRGKVKAAKAYSSSGTLLWTEEYRYDAAGRNAHTIHIEAAQSPEEKFSIYDGFDMYSLVMELDGNERITMNAMHSPAVDMVLAEDRLNYDSSGNVADHDIQWPLGVHQNFAIATSPPNKAASSAKTPSASPAAKPIIISSSETIHIWGPIQAGYKSLTRTLIFSYSEMGGVTR